MEAEMATSVMVILRVKYDFTLGALGDFPLILQHRFSCSVANLVIFLRRGDGNPAKIRKGVGAALGASQTLKHLAFRKGFLTHQVKETNAGDIADIIADRLIG